MHIDPRSNAVACVPRPIDSGDQLADANAAERRHSTSRSSGSPATLEAYGNGVNGVPLSVAKMKKCSRISRIDYRSA